jgi:hypothetical protein
MIDIEIHGTGQRYLLSATRKSLVGASYLMQLTIVDTGSDVYSYDEIQTLPFARVYAPPEVLPEVISDIRTRLADLFTTLEGVQIVRVAHPHQT